MSVTELNTGPLNKFRNDKADSENRTILAKEQLRIALIQEEQLNRYYNPDNKEHIALKRELQQKIEEARSAISDEEAIRIGIDKELGAAWSEVAPYIDPKTNLNKLDEAYPILLFPLRIETRFKRITGGNRDIDQLWVRVYPDDCSIDTFEEALSEAEVNDTENFWVNWWSAMADENQQREVWKSLVNGYGHGRAQYLINNYRPENFETILNPAEDLSTTIYLVINGGGEIKDVEKLALEQFWLATCKAKEDAGLLQNAKEQLDSVLGQERATVLATDYQPTNLTKAIEADESISISVKFIEFTKEPEKGKKSQSWSQAPKVLIMPERLYLQCYTNDTMVVEELGAHIPFPLIVGPDPHAKEEDMEYIPDADLKVSPEMKWMIDFEEAVSKGMGFKVDLTPQQVESGFDKLFVLGVKMSLNRMDGKTQLETLLQHHYDGNSGISLLPVGTPTNNTLNSSSGYSESSDPDDSYDQVFKKEEESGDDPTQWWAKSDREWFTEMLGISENTLKDAVDADGYDQCEARAMNISLWSSTWGYFFDTLLRPVLSDKQIEQVRWYFNHFVVGRGTIPSIRIDDQPYGILPTTVFSRISWFNGERNLVPTDINDEVPDGFLNFLSGLYQKFLLIQEDWKEMAKDVSFVGKEGDAHQILLDILGLHGGSVEFYNRLSEGLNHIHNMYAASQSSQSTLTEMLAQKKVTTDKQLSTSVIQSIIASTGSLAGRMLLNELGYTGEEAPEILEKAFLENAQKLYGPLIDDLPLSEVNQISDYSTGADGSTPENYIKWLIRVAGHSFDKLRKEEGFIDNQKPNALLYLMLRNSLEQGYYDAGLRLFQEKNLISDANLAIARKEADFIHIREAASNAAAPITHATLKSTKVLDSPFYTESRYGFLYQTQSEITGSPEMTVAEHIPSAINHGHIATKYLGEQIEALKLLESSPTARLERCMVEHIDCASYRFDAWKSGLINYQLKSLRNRMQKIVLDDGEKPIREDINKGIYIGAYGWIENLRPENKVFTPASISTELQEIFTPDGTSTIYNDDTNLGYINAPSLNHAVTAAILRNGYESRAEEGNANAFNINLSSERVRKALGIIQGIQNGQNLAALLGYQFERGIHDNNKTSNVDHFVFKLRRKFPLSSNQMSSTHESDQDVPIEALEARNVVNGLDLIEFAEENLGANDEPLYFDSLGLGEVTDAEKAIIVNEINNIRDINDAVADLAFSESIHQVVQSNIDRAAGTLDSYSTGNYPQVPEVIQTPRSGVNLTHRVGIQIKGDADPAVSGYTPRAKAEPGLNLFLKDILPETNSIYCYVSFRHAPTDTVVSDYAVSMADLGLQPIDLFYMLDGETNQAMGKLDDMVVNRIYNTSFAELGGENVRPDTEISITYFNVQPDTVSVFELFPLISHLKSTIKKSRALQPSDLILSNEANSSSDTNVFLDRTRVELIINAVTPAKTNLDSFISVLETSLADDGDDDATIISNIDNTLEVFMSRMEPFGLFGFIQLGTSFVHEWKRTQLTNIYKYIEELLEKWEQKETRYSDLLSDYASLATDELKIERLLKAERTISSATTDDPGTDPAAFKTNVVDVKKAGFDAQRITFENYLTTNHQLISTAISTAPLSYGDYYPVETDLSDIENACLLFADDILQKAKKLQTDVGNRLDAASALLVKHDSEATSNKKVLHLQDAAKQLLGEDFIMVPSFEVPADFDSEWKNSLDHNDELLSYQTEELKNLLPVDDWFYGVARVREKMEHFEQAIILAEGFKDISVELTPTQFPYTDPYCWFALEYGHKDPAIKEQVETIFRENDHLLYTAYYHQPYAPGTPQCGLLIDEWTEVVPTEEETTGVTFHYDRPNSEPPQSLLLAMSPNYDRNGWNWNDLVDILHETLQEAKLRAVEPQQIDKTKYANFLPATVSTVTKYPISIMLNYAFNNIQLIDTIQTNEDEG